MTLFPLDIQFLKPAAGIAALMFLAACSDVATFGGTGTGADQRFASASASAAEISAASPSALPAIARECPPIQIMDGGSVFTDYLSGKEGQARALKYQAVIDQQSRNCTVSDGLIMVKMGVVGRVLVGPQGEPGTVTVPLRFAVVRDGLTIFTQKYEIPIVFTPPSQTEEFIKVVENIAVPYIGGEKITFVVGFDPVS
ncbi:MAG: hypothetical protein GXP01_08560 [Alphaproteobacteria bacterium]|nr:hypothetical protein [Alphaproteobacteria bacterium]